MEYLEIKNKIDGADLRTAKKLLYSLVFEDLKKQYGDDISLSSDGWNILYKGFCLVGLSKDKKRDGSTCYKLTSSVYNYKKEITDKINAGIKQIDRHDTHIFNNENDIFIYHYDTNAGGLKLVITSKRLYKYKMIKKDIKFYKEMFVSANKEIAKLTDRREYYKDKYNNALIALKNIK